MGKLLTLLITVAILNAAHAEPRVLNKPVTCDTRLAVFKTIVEEFGETPQWIGPSPQQGTNMALTVNLKTGAWTLIEFTADVACVISVGENSSSAWGTKI